MVRSDRERKEKGGGKKKRYSCMNRNQKFHAFRWYKNFTACPFEKLRNRRAKYWVD